MRVMLMGVNPPPASDALPVTFNADTVVSGDTAVGLGVVGKSDLLQAMARAAMIPKPRRRVLCVICAFDGASRLQSTPYQPQSMPTTGVTRSLRPSLVSEKST